MYELFDDTTKAYLAGILDGEGSIVIFRRAPIKKHHTPQHVVSIAIKMNAPAPAILLFYKHCKGNLNSYKRNGVMQVSWISNKHSDIENLLINLQPFLLVKQQQAQLALDFINYFKANTMLNVSDPNKKLSIVNKRTEFSDQMSILNTGKICRKLA